MKVTIGFSFPNKWKIGAAAISWWINKPYSHVFIKYTDNQNRELVFHAAHGMVHLITYENFLKHNKTVKEINLDFNEDEYQKFRNYYYNKLATPYSYIELILILMYDLKLLRPKQDDPGYICSELAGEMLKIVKNINFEKSKNLLRPDDIERALNNVNKV